MASLAPLPWWDRLRTRTSFLGSLPARSARGGEGAVVEGLEQRWLLSGSLSTIATFSGTNGVGVLAALPDSSGNIFGITSVSEPAPNIVGPGEVYEIPAGTSTIDVLSSFASFGSNTKGQSMVMDSAGNLFGTTFNGGANGSGFVFEVAKGSSTITELASFPAAAHPVANQGATAVDSSDDVFGIDVNGNPFELVHGSGSITTLAQSSSIVSDLELASDGTLFGTTYGGGDNAAGSIFDIPAGASTINTLASLGPATTGSKPLGLAIDSSGNLFGVCENGGANGNGTVFELPAGSSRVLLVATLSSSTGATPICRPVLDSSGNLFAMAQNGGANGDGTLMEVPAGGNVATDAGDLTNADIVGQDAATVDVTRDLAELYMSIAVGGFTSTSGTTSGEVLSHPTGSSGGGGGGGSQSTPNPGPQKTDWKGLRDAFKQDVTDDTKAQEQAQKASNVNPGAEISFSSRAVHPDKLSSTLAAQFAQLKSMLNQINSLLSSTLANINTATHFYSLFNVQSKAIAKLSAKAENTTKPAAQAKLQEQISKDQASENNDANSDTTAYNDAASSLTQISTLETNFQSSLTSVEASI